MSLIRISRDETFESSPFPLRIHSTVTAAQTDQFAYECTKLMFITEGSTTLRHQGGMLDLNEGDAVVLPHGRWFAGHPNPRVSTTTLYLDTSFLTEQIRWLPNGGALLRDYLSSGHAMAPAIIGFDSRSRFQLQGILVRMARETNSAIREYELLARVMDVLSMIQRTMTPPPQSTLIIRDEVQAAMQILEEELAYNWTVTELAARVALSPAQLTRLFNRHLGTGPAAFLRRTRIRHLAEILTSTDMDIATAAKRVGWQDQSQASRAFRAGYGLSPQQFRRAHWQ